MWLETGLMGTSVHNILIYEKFIIYSIPIYLALFFVAPQENSTLLKNEHILLVNWEVSKQWRAVFFSFIILIYHAQR